MWVIMGSLLLSGWVYYVCNERHDGEWEGIVKV